MKTAGNAALKDCIILHLNYREGLILFLKHKCHRPVVHKFYFHHGPEYTCFHFAEMSFQTVYKISVEPVAFFRRGGIDETWPASFAAISKQGELGDHQCFAVYIFNRQIHFTLLVRENAQFCTFGSQEVRFLRSVVFVNAQKKHYSPVDTADNFSIYFYAGAGDSLKHYLHIKILPGNRL